MFEKIARPSSTAATIDGEVVVGQHDVGRFLGDVGAGDAHRHADVGGLQRGRVVHAVAGHGDDRAVRLQRLHDAQLVLGIDARVDRHFLHACGAAPRRTSSPARRRCSARRPEAMPSSAAITAAVAGWSPVIMIGRMPAAFGARDRVLRFGARRVDHPDEAGEHQLVLELVVEAVVSSASAGSRRKATPMVRSASPASASLACRISRAPRARQRALASAPTSSCEQRPSSTSGAPLVKTSSRPSRSASEWTVLISLRAEENGTSPTRSKRASSASSVEPRLARRDEQRALGRVALHGPAPVALLQHRVVGAVAHRQRSSRLQLRAPGSACVTSPSGA